jgi:nucleoid DNA-binding protein
MNQSELIEKVGQATELNQTAAGQAVKAVVNAIIDALVAIQIAASKAVRFHAGKAVKDALNPPTPKGAPRKKTPTPKKSAMRR